MFFEYLILVLVVGTTWGSAAAVLGFLIACVHDRIAIRRGKAFGRELTEQDLAKYRRNLKKNRKRLLIASIICACAWTVVFVFSYMILANM